MRGLRRQTSRCCSIRRHVVFLHVDCPSVAVLAPVAALPVTYGCGLTWGAGGPKDCQRRIRGHSKKRTSMPTQIFFSQSVPISVFTRKDGIDLSRCNPG